MIRVTTAAATGAVALAVARYARTTESRDRLCVAVERAPFRVPSVVRAHLEPALRRAAIDTTVERALQLWSLGAVVAVLVAATLSLGLVVVALPCALVAPVVGLATARRRGDRRAEAALPDALRMIAAELRAGSALAQGIERVSRSDSSLRGEFDRIAERLHLGTSIEAAVKPWPEERPTPGVAVAAAALACVGTAGGPTAKALDGLARSLADRHAVADEQRAQAAQARISAVVVGLAPLAYLIFAAVVDAGSIASLVGRPIGRLCLGVGIGLDALALLWMRRITRDPELGW